MASPRIFCRYGGTKASPMPGGMVRLEVWTEDQAPDDDPQVFQCTPGQALLLIEDLSRAAKIALTETIK